MSVFRRLQMIVNARARDAWTVAGWPRANAPTARQDDRSATQTPNPVSVVAGRVFDGRCTPETCIAPDCVEAPR